MRLAKKQDERHPSSGVGTRDHSHERGILYPGATWKIQVQTSCFRKSPGPTAAILPPELYLYSGGKGVKGKIYMNYSPRGLDTF